MTSKLQVTVPKVIAEQYRIKPGDEITWLAAGDSIRVLPRGRGQSKVGTTSRLRLFDQATSRQRIRDGAVTAAAGPRGWLREEIYDRGRSR